MKATKRKISLKKTKKILEQFTADKVIKRHFSLLKINHKNWMIK